MYMSVNTAFFYVADVTGSLFFSYHYSTVGSLRCDPYWRYIMTVPVASGGPPVPHTNSTQHESHHRKKKMKSNSLYNEPLKYVSHRYYIYES